MRQTVMAPNGLHWTVKRLIVPTGMRPMSRGEKSFERDPDGTWQEIGGPTEVGEFVNPGGGLGRVVSVTRIRRWLRRRQA